VKNFFEDMNQPTRIPLLMGRTAGGGSMFTTKARILATGLLVIVGLGIAAIFLQGAMDQARQTSCNYGSSGDNRCLAPHVANYGLSSDGEERKVTVPAAGQSAPAKRPSSQ
jgi:hypothetical protein